MVDEKTELQLELDARNREIILNAKLNQNVPPLYRHIRLEELAPSEKSLMPPRLQEKYIRMIQADPDAGWAFFGPVGWSKTTFSVALYRHAVEQELADIWLDKEGDDREWAGYPWYVKRSSAKAILDEHHTYATGRANGREASKPEICRDYIKMWSRCRYRLFLEEIDKIQITPFRRDCLFEVFDAVYEWRGQLVINTNLTPQEFQSPEFLGPEFARRVKEMCNVVNMFEETQ